MSKKEEKNVVSFEFSVSGAEFEEAIEKAYRKNVGKIAVQGFRKGKAPRKIIENYYGKRKNCMDLHCMRIYILWG